MTITDLERLQTAINNLLAVRSFRIKVDWLTEGEHVFFTSDNAHRKPQPCPIVPPFPQYRSSVVQTTLTNSKSLLVLWDKTNQPPCIWVAG